ncbi:hypothetical protein [Agarivorans litoreus]|uniref:hypothetical protein n=1 Tax=Agarivorans litoreus TaxID=1510455 RepID=UPI001C7DCAC8|nr:hypothetical protein [Agarivorans litoreus]
MFSRNDIENIDFQNNRLGCYRGLYSTFYNQYSFRVPDSEESIRISRAPKSAQDNGMLFWLAAELQDNWNGREQYFEPYIIDSDFKNISEYDFNSMVSSQCSDLIIKPVLPLNSGKFIGALAMCTMERELIVDLFAEYEDEFIHFIWESTA